MTLVDRLKQKALEAGYPKSELYIEAADYIEKQNSFLDSVKLIAQAANGMDSLHLKQNQIRDIIQLIDLFQREGVDFYPSKAS